MEPHALQSETLTLPASDPRLKAIGLMTISVFLINVMNAMVKLVSDVHPPLEIMFYRGTIAMAVLLLWALYRGKLATIYKTARPWSHFGRGLFGNIGLLLVIWSFTLLPMADATATLAEASLLSPFNYTAILWSTLLGWIFWGDVPTLAVTTGATIIIASNLLIIYRERRR